MKTRIEEAAQTINLTDANASPMDLARALDDDGHLLPDLPEQDEIAYPGPTKIWDVGDHHFVEYDRHADTISLSRSFGEEIRLDPDDIPAAVSALLAAHHERNQE